MREVPGVRRWHRALALSFGLLLIAATALVAQTAAPPQRIVSLIPSVTEALFAIGAGPRVVGVSNFDRFPPEAATKTKVGDLIDPATSLRQAAS